MEDLIKQCIVEGVKVNQVPTLLTLYFNEVKKQELSQNDLSALCSLANMLDWKKIIFELSNKFEIPFVAVYNKDGSFKGNYLYTS